MTSSTIIHRRRTRRRTRRRQQQHLAGPLLLPLLTIITVTAANQHLINTDPHTYRFAPLGHITLARSTAHLVLTIPLFQAARKVILTKATVQRIHPQYRQKHNVDQRIQRSIDATYSILSSMGLSSHFDKFMTKMNNLERATPQHPRQKRFIFTIIATVTVLVAVAAAAHGIAEVVRIRDDVNELQHEERVIGAAISELETNLNKTAAALESVIDDINAARESDHFEDWANHLASEAERTVNELRHVANAANEKRLDAALVTPETLATSMATIRTRANKHSLRVPEMTGAALQSCQTSYILDGNFTFSYLVHIPLTSATYEMNIYKFDQHPILTAAGYVQLGITRPFLAVTKDHSSFLTMSREDLAACFPFGAERVCPAHAIIKKPDADLDGVDEERCLFAAFSKSDTGVSNHCALSQVNRVEHVEQLNATHYSIFTTKTTNVAVSCNGKMVEQRSFTGAATVSVPFGCTANTHGHVMGLVTPTTVSSDANVIDVAMPPSLADFLNATATVIHKATLLRTSVSAQLRGERHNILAATSLQQHISRPHGIGFSILALIFLVAALVGIGCCLKRCISPADPNAAAATGLSTVTSAISASLAASALNNVSASAPPTSNIIKPTPSRYLHPSCSK